MNEITKVNFEYALVSEETARLLKSKKNQLDGIYFRYTSEVGQVLYEAQQELADYNNDGLFSKWVEAAGFKRQRAYEYINIYKYAVRITDNEELEIFEKQPKSIQTEMSKPSALPKVNEAVYSGEITKHKEYKELEKKLKVQEERHQRQLKDKDEVINSTYKQLERAQQQEPTVIEKEVIPEDYEKIKQENEQLKQSNQKLQRDLEWVQDDLKLKQTQYSLLESSTAEAKELERKIQSLQSQEKTIVEKMEAVETFYELERNFNDFFDTKMAPMRFKGIANHLYATNAVDRIRSMITQAELWAEEMNKILPNKNMKILEGEIIND